MTLTKIATVALMILGAGFVTPANAVTVFNFTGQNDTQNSISLTRSGLTLVVSAFELTSTGATNPRNIDRDNTGWGVEGSPDDGRVGFRSSENLTEFLELSFAAPVSVDSVSFFHEGDANGRVRFGTQQAGIPVFRIDGDARSESFTPDFAISDTWFVRGDGRGLRLASITVSAIPLPATVWMLLASVGGLCLMRRFRRQSA